jgi:hypothetical protein
MVIEQLRAHDVPVRALVHHDDERAAALRGAHGVDVVVGDLTRGADDEWLSDLRELHLPPHVFDHIATMARLHKQNRYDRVTNDIADLLGRSPSAFASFVRNKAALRDAEGPADR